MASADIYVRKDVYEADQRALISEIKLIHNELLKKIDEKFEEKIDAFRKEVNAKFEAVDKRLDALEGRVSRLETKVEVLVARVDSLETRINDSNNFMMIGFGLLGFLIVFTAFISPISRRLRMWSKPKRINITSEEVELIKEIITSNFVVKARTKPLP